MSPDDPRQPPDETVPLRTGGAAPLAVLAADPASGEEGVSVRIQPTVTFSSPLDPRTVTPATFRLVRQGTAVPVTAQVVVDAATRSATLAPTAGLESGAAYVATVEGGPRGVRGADGGELATDIVWGFTIEERRRGRGWLIGLLAAGLALAAGVLVWAFAFNGDEGVDASPSSIDFGDQNIGQRSAVQTVTVTNDGGETTIDSIEIQGTNPKSFSIADASTCATGQLAQGDSCTIGVRFTPSQRGERSAELAVALAEGDPLSVSLTGSGVGEGVLSAGTNQIDFGTVLLGGNPATRQVEFTNSGTAPIALTKIGIEGDDAASFAVSNGATTCTTDTPLAASASCIVAVAFSPQEVGPASASLVLEHDGTGGSTQVALAGQGKGQAAGTLAPDTADFGSVDVGGTSEPQTFTVTSTGTGDLPISTIAIDGPDAGEFEVTGDGTCNEGATLAAGDECTVVVVFIPTDAGARTGELDVAGGPSALTAALTGTGSPASTG